MEIKEEGKIGFKIQPKYQSFTQKLLVVVKNGRGVIWFEKMGRRGIWVEKRCSRGFILCRSTPVGNH
jgi:hypothetical protein